MIEEALYTHPAVALAAAVGKPDAYAGELPVAYVALKTGATVTEQALLDYAQQTVKERAALPKSIVVLDQMPVTADWDLLQTHWQDLSSSKGLPNIGTESWKRNLVQQNHASLRKSQKSSSEEASL